MTWMDQLRFGVAHILLNGVGTTLPWRGKLNFLNDFYAADNPTLGATDIGISLATGATTGQIAVAAAGTPTTWTAEDPAVVLRTGYDISVASTSVPNDGLGTGYATILDTTRATLFSATQRHRDIAIVFTVRDYAAAPTDPIDTVFATIVFTRRDSTADTLVTDAGMVDSSSPAIVTGTITLPAIGQTMGYRFRCGSGGTATHVYLEILRDVAEDRYVSAKLYLGPEETIA